MLCKLGVHGEDVSGWRTCGLHFDGQMILVSEPRHKIQTHTNKKGLVEVYLLIIYQSTARAWNLSVWWR